jgi:hypothetical protein
MQVEQKGGALLPSSSSPSFTVVQCSCYRRECNKLIVVGDAAGDAGDAVSDPEKSPDHLVDIKNKVYEVYHAKRIEPLTNQTDVRQYLRFFAYSCHNKHNFFSEFLNRLPHMLKFQVSMNDMLRMRNRTDHSLSRLQERFFEDVILTDPRNVAVLLSYLGGSEGLMLAIRNRIQVQFEFQWQSALKSKESHKLVLARKSSLRKQVDKIRLDLYRLLKEKEFVELSIYHIPSTYGIYPNHYRNARRDIAPTYRSIQNVFVESPILRKSRKRRREEVGDEIDWKAPTPTPSSSSLYYTIDPKQDLLDLDNCQERWRHAFTDISNPRSRWFDGRPDVFHLDHVPVLFPTTFTRPFILNCAYANWFPYDLNEEKRAPVPNLEDRLAFCQYQGDAIWSRNWNSVKVIYAKDIPLLLKLLKQTRKQLHQYVFPPLAKIILSYAPVVCV